MLTPQQQVVLASIAHFMCDFGRQELSATIWEDGHRACILREGFAIGWTFGLNSNTPRYEVDGRGTCLRGAPAGSKSVDVEVIAPARLRMEIKVNGVFGPSRTRPRAEMNRDFQKVIDLRVDTFIILSDAVDYDAIRHPRGTNPLHFGQELPARHAIAAHRQMHNVRRGGAAAIVEAVQFPSPFGLRVWTAFYLP